MISSVDYFDIFNNLLKAKCLRRFNFAPPPRVIAYTVTWRCNAACEMCGIKNVDRSLKNKESELTAQDIARIFKDPLLKKLDLIRFTGGEPFLKEDFADIVEAIIDNTRTKIYYITTNGFYSKRIFDFIKRLAPKNKNLVIQISLDAIGKTHDDIRKVPGLYDKIIYTLEGLRKLKRKYRFSFGINQTVTADALNYLEDISALCNKFDCDHKIYLAHETHESHILEGKKHSSQLALIGKPDKKMLKCLYERIEEHYKQIENKRGDLSTSEILWDVVQKYILQGSKNRLLEGKEVPNPPCLAMFFYLRLLPDGKVMPCTLKSDVVGNLKKQTFREIWNSKAAQKIRREVRSCPGCWVECDITPNLVYSFIVVKEFIKRFFLLFKRFVF